MLPSGITERNTVWPCAAVAANASAMRSVACRMWVDLRNACTSNMNLVAIGHGVKSNSDKITAMSQLQFVHLRLHSEYSVTDGIVRLDDAVEAAVADGMPALALTDLANVFGLVKFYQAARGKGL